MVEKLNICASVAGGGGGGGYMFSLKTLVLVDHITSELLSSGLY